MKFKIKPWKHQKDLIDKLVETRVHGLFFDMGTGKTSTAINLYRQKCYKHKRALPCLIICPIIVKQNWKREFGLHSHLEDIVQVIHGNPKQRDKQFKEAGKTIYVINPEMINTNTWKTINNMNFEFLIVDESHRFKNPTGKRTKALLKFCKAQQKLWYRFILTGTPILNNGMDIWAQFQILDRNIFNPNFYVFRDQFFQDMNSGMPRGSYFPKWVPYKNTAEELGKTIARFSTRAVGVLDLPPLTFQTVNVELGSEQRKLYNDLERDLVAELDGEVMSADLAIVKSLRLQQLVSGIFVADKDQIDSFTEKVKPKHFSENRLKVIRELIEGIGKEHSIIIWSVWAPTYKELAKLLDSMGETYTFITGEQNEKQKQQAEQDFQAKKFRFLIANPSAGGEGVNLTAATYMIYYNRRYGLKEDLQSVKRFHRGGQDKPTHRIDMISEGTIDQDIQIALKYKLNTAELILSIKKRLGK